MCAHLSFMLMSTKCQKFPKLAKICRDSSSQKKALKQIRILVLIFNFNIIQSVICDGFSCECAGTCAMCEISPQLTVWFYYWNKYTIFSGHIFSCWIKVVIFRTRFLSLVHCVRRCVFVFWPTRPHEKKMSGINIAYLLIKSVRWN